MLIDRVLLMALRFAPKIKQFARSKVGILNGCFILCGLSMGQFDPNAAGASTANALGGARETQG